MKVKELIEKLQELDPQSLVNCYAGYDRDYGAQWSYVTKVDIEQVGWDDDLKAPIIEVFIE